MVYMLKHERGDNYVLAPKQLGADPKAHWLTIR